MSTNEQVGSTAAFEQGSPLQLLPIQGWYSGLANLQRKERRFWGVGGGWIKHILLWPLILDGFYFLTLATVVFTPGVPQTGPAAYICIQLFLSMLTLFASMGTVIQLQDAIIGERQSGTAAWVLSKPVSRPAFILAKCSLLPGMLLTMALIPGPLAILIMGVVASVTLPPVILVLLLSYLVAAISFYFGLTLLLGTLCKSRGPVLAIGLVLALLTGQLGRPLSEQIAANSVGTTWLVVFGLLSAGLFCVLAAIWRFNREEL